MNKEMLVCKKCNVEKPKVDFYKKYDYRPGKRYVYYYVCKSCHAHRMMDWVSRNKERNLKIQRVGQSSYNKRYPEKIKAHREVRKALVKGELAHLACEKCGKMLRWVAKRGYIEDWTIYLHWATSSWEYIEDSGDKPSSENNIKKLVPCTDEAFGMYRY